MVGAQLRGKPDRWKNVLHKLQNADLDRIRQSFPEYPHPDLLRAIDVSMEALDEDLRGLYLDFALFPEDCPIPEVTVQLVWRLNQYDTEDAIDRLVELSLATRDEQKRLRVHDLLLDYLRRRLGAVELVDHLSHGMSRFFQILRMLLGVPPKQQVCLEQNRGQRSFQVMGNDGDDTVHLLIQLFRLAHRLFCFLVRGSQAENQDIDDNILIHCLVSLAHSSN